MICDVHFWNGRLVTSADWVYSFERIINPATQAGAASFWMNIVGAKEYAAGKATHVSGIKALGKWGLQITLLSPDASLCAASGGIVLKNAGSQPSGPRSLADYGLSEVPGHAAHGLREAEAKMVKTEGRPYDGTEIRILGPDGAPVPAGEVGDVVVNGPSRFLGFLGNDELTRESLAEWGGYHTGDLGYLDEDGHLVYVGRSKDIIRRGGVTVVPAEIEPVLMRHPAIHEAAIVPLARRQPVRSDRAARA